MPIRIVKSPVPRKSLVGRVEPVTGAEVGSIVGVEVTLLVKAGVRLVGVMVEVKFEVGVGLVVGEGLGVGDNFAEGDAKGVGVDLFPDGEAE